MSVINKTIQKVPNYIGGQWVESTTTEWDEVYNPATGELIAYVPLSSSEEVDHAVHVAQTAYQSWKKIAVPKRARYFFDYQQLLVKHWDELAALITLENGKSLEEAYGEV